MQSDTSPFGLRGFLIDAPEFGALRGRPNGAVLIDNGRISEIGDYDDLRRLRPNSIRWLDRRTAAIFPGLIDCHTHLPQYSVIARGESETHETGDERELAPSPGVSSGRHETSPSVHESSCAGAPVRGHAAVE